MRTIEILKEHLSKKVFSFGYHPGMTPEEAAIFYVGHSEEVAPGVYLHYSVGNSTTFICDEGLMQVDCHTPGGAALEKIAELRKRTDLPFHTIAITHGHPDHCGGLYHYIKDNEQRSYPPPWVIAPFTLRKNLDIKQMLTGHTNYVNSRQFKGIEARGKHTQIEAGSDSSKATIIYPNIEFQDRLDVTIGKEVFHVVYSGGHTDDAAWVYCPSRKVLCSGDDFEWAAPNVGNPYKMQRYAKESAKALEEMASCGAEVLCPGHGPVIHGRDEIKTCLLTAARYIHHIQNHVVDCMNKGMLLEETIKSLKMPEELLNSKWLRPLHGHPVFIAYAIYHRYGGYYNGNPAQLLPPAYADISQEVITLANGVGAVVNRAKELQADGKIDLACQLAEWAVKGDPKFKEAWEIYGLLFKERAEKEVNLQARGCWNTAVNRAINALESLNDL